MAAVSNTLNRPPFWLVIGLEWPAQATEPYAECALAMAPNLIPKSVLSPPAYAILELAKAVAPAGDQQVVMFSELTQTLARRNADWTTAGVPDWEAALDELAQAPVPSLFLSLSQYAHIVLCTAGIGNNHIHRPDGQQERITATDLNDLRNNLRTVLSTDWPAYIQTLESEGKIRPAD